MVRRTDYILRACRNKRVLHVGCADYPFTEYRLAAGKLLHDQVEKVAEVQYGLDLSEEGIAILRRAGYKRLAVGDVEELARTSPFGDIAIDVVLAGEIVEHLSNPGLFLEGLKPIFKNNRTKLVVTTINAYSAHRFFFSAVSGREEVHPEHTCYFSEKTLASLLTRHGYSIEDTCTCPIEYVEEADEVDRGWPQKARRWLLHRAVRVTCSLRPALAEGVMVTCSLQQMHAQ
jgi:hypothetical protein